MDSGSPGPARQEPIRVVLIEDNRLACDQLAALLDGDPNFEVVATAASAMTGLAQVQEAKPHVALIDVGLCNSEAHRCFESVKQMAPETRVIMMDVQPAADDIVPLIEAGANGFILKDATVNDFVGTIRSVAEGRGVVPPPLTSVLWSHIAGAATSRTSFSGRIRSDSLTTREREVSALIAEGFANKDIGGRLGIATHTVKSHVHSILKKLGLRTRLQIAARS